jgi:AcrR family transcriptional regulator
MAARGRPRCFDRTCALEQAMEVFWERGYEGASVAELTAAMGIAAPSLYAAFSSKEELFRESVRHYLQTDGSGIWQSLDDEPSARLAVVNLLKAGAEAATMPNKPAGCFLVHAMANCSPENIEMQLELQERRVHLADLLRLRLDRGIADGDIRPGTDTRSLSAYFITVLQGMSMRARDGGSRTELMQAAEYALAAWPGT